MNATSTRADAFVVFGITGDLAAKMTFRALYRLEAAGRPKCPIIGLGHADWSHYRLVRAAQDCLPPPATAGFSATIAAGRPQPAGLADRSGPRSPADPRLAGSGRHDRAGRAHGSAFRRRTRPASRTVRAPAARCADRRALPLHSRRCRGGNLANTAAHDRSSAETGVLPAGVVGADRRRRAAAWSSRPATALAARHRHMTEPCTNPRRPTLRAEIRR